MDTTLLINPVVTPITVAILASGSVLAAVIWQRGAILAAIGQARAKLFTRSGFFWTVIGAFLAVSVWQSGQFFAISGDYAGFMVALFLDLVTVVLMHAQLESRYRGEHFRANLFIFFICLTCGMSTYANLAMSTNTFDAVKMLPNSPQWIQGIAPYALASSPLFVIMLSIASEMIINVRPLDQLDEEDYEADEQKRVRLLDIRYQYAIRQQEIEAEREAEKQRIKAQRAQRKAEHDEVMKRIKESGKKQKSTQITTSQPQAPAPVPTASTQQTPAPQLQVMSEQTTDELQASEIQAALNEARPEPISNQSEIVEEVKRDCAWYRSQSQTNLTVSETALVCNVTEQVVKGLRTRTILKSPSPNSQLITLASIELYLSTRKQGTRKSKQNTASMPVIESIAPANESQNETIDTADIDRLLVSAAVPKYRNNGQSKETIKLDEYALV